MAILFATNTITYESDLRAEIERIMNGGIPTATFHHRGKKNMRFLPLYLRYCPLCAKEDKAAYGETYWHRSHQMQGLVYCVNHATQLINSNILVRNTTRHFYPASNEISTDFEADAHDEFAPFKNELLKIGWESEWLLNNGLNVEWEINGREKYCHILRENGLASIKGFCDYEALDSDFNAFWGKELLDILFQDTANFKGWMYQIQEVRIRSFSPLHHILLMCFLKGGVKAFIDCEPSGDPFGGRSFSWENPICPHYHTGSVVDTEIQYFGGGVKGIFQCTLCGMRYRFVISPRDSGNPVIIDYGHLWINELHRCAREKLSLSETAETLKCSKAFVMQQKKKHNLIKLLPYDSEIGSEKYHKSQILALCKKYGEVNTALLRAEIPNAYSYLLRHDYDWLRSHIVYNKDSHQCGY